MQQAYLQRRACLFFRCMQKLVCAALVLRYLDPSAGHNHHASSLCGSSPRSACLHLQPIAFHTSPPNPRHASARSLVLPMASYRHIRPTRVSCFKEGTDSVSEYLQFLECIWTCEQPDFVTGTVTPCPYLVHTCLKLNTISPHNGQYQSPGRFLNVPLPTPRFSDDWL